MKEITKNRKFDHVKVFEKLKEFGFRKTGKELYPLYFNSSSYIISYYMAKKETPEKKGAFVFIHKENRLYAYSFEEIENVYLELLELIKK